MPEETDFLTEYAALCKKHNKRILSCTCCGLWVDDCEPGYDFDPIHITEL